MTLSENEIFLALTDMKREGYYIHGIDDEFPPPPTLRGTQLQIIVTDLNAIYV
jgi:hypothetical protein